MVTVKTHERKSKKGKLAIVREHSRTGRLPTLKTQKFESFNLSKKYAKANSERLKRLMEIVALPPINLTKYDENVKKLKKAQADFSMSPEVKAELVHQIRALGISGTLVDMGNGIRVNKGETNFDVFYDDGHDTYSVFVIHTPRFKPDDFTWRLVEDVYFDQLPDIINKKVRI